MNTIRLTATPGLLLALGAALLTPSPLEAHCDGMDGPVVKAAQKALAEGDVDLVLIWVREEDEEEIRRAFDRTLAVRELGEDARALADLYFFETLVRVHRAGEGAPYTGLKPAGRDLGPAIPLADRVLDTGALEPLVDLLTAEVLQGLRQRLEEVREARDYATGDVEAGREWVRAYVTFIHYVERAYEAASQPVAGHFPETGHTGEEHGY